MPQATEELRKEWNGPMDDVALNHLRDRGYRLTRGWEWVPPLGTEISMKDFSAITFLVQEWDFGGLVEMQDNKFRYKDDKGGAPITESDHKNEDPRFVEEPEL